MNIEEGANDRFLVYRNIGYRRSYFLMWVDADKSSWTLLRESASRFRSKVAAQDAIIEIKRRNKVRRTSSTQRSSG